MLIDGTNAIVLYTMEKFTLENETSKALLGNFLTLQCHHILSNSLGAGSRLSHARERRRAKRSGGKESGEEAPRKPLPRLAASLLACLRRALMLQREPARRLVTQVTSVY